MKLIVDGWSILILYKGGIFVFFITLLGLGYWGFEYFFTANDQKPFVRFFTRLGIGSLLLTWTSLLIVLMGRLWLPFLSIGSMLLPTVCFIYLLWIAWKRKGISFDISHFPAAIGVGLMSFIFLLARLAFLQKIVLPPYDDSPDHFTIVKDLLSNADANQPIFYVLRNGAEKYYHIGFHSVAAWLASASHIDPALTMTLLGQVFIFFSSLSILYLILVTTGSIYAGIVAAVFAAAAWSMPAFAANWGKYPAFTGLALLPMWLGLLQVYNWRSKNRLASIIFSISILLGLVLIHTRLIICLIIIGIAYIVSLRAKINSLPAIPQFFIVICAGLLIPFLFLTPVEIFYSNNYYLAFGLMALLLPFACLKYPRYMIGISLSMFGVWMASRVPVLFGLYGTNWLDAPFVEILLYIPFSLISGLGFSGLLDKLGNYPVIKKLTAIIPILILISGFTSLNLFYPDHCCNYVTSKDLKAINWIKENTPIDSVVWVSGFKPHNYMIGTDAGVWVFPLTGRNTNKLPFNFNWGSPSAREKICQSGYRDVNVYKGGLDYSFDETALSKAAWLETVYADGQIKIYRVSCLSGP